MKYESEKTQIDNVSSLSESQTLRRPEESVYYDPVYNPLGTPPPGYPPMFKAPSVSGQQFPPATPSLAPYGYLLTGSSGKVRSVVSPPIPSRPTSAPRVPVDPLDPAAAGYNLRFGSESQKRKRSEPALEDVPTIPNSCPPEFTETFSAVPHISSNAISSTPLHTETSDPLVPMVDLAELMKRRKIVVSEVTEVVGPSLPNASTQDLEITSGPQTSSILGINYSSDSEPENESAAPETSYRPPVPPEKSSNLLPEYQPRHDRAEVTLPTPVQVTTKPKQVRVESDLVSLVPAALRVKRKEQSSSKVPPVSSANPSRKIDSPIRNSVDAAYEAFMLEINQLG